MQPIFLLLSRYFTMTSSTHGSSPVIFKTIGRLYDGARADMHEPRPPSMSAGEMHSCFFFFTVADRHPVSQERNDQKRESVPLLHLEISLPASKHEDSPDDTVAVLSKLLNPLSSEFKCLPLLGPWTPNLSGCPTVVIVLEQRANLKTKELFVQSTMDQSEDFFTWSWTNGS